MHAHFHAYSWAGQKRDFDRERDRRPDGPGFATADLPPLQTAHWLLKPVRLVRATYDHPKEAADWLAERVREHVTPSSLQPPLETQLALAVETLSWGGDVSWGCYAAGTRFVSLAVVCCPSRAEPAVACPLR